MLRCLDRLFLGFVFILRTACGAYERKTANQKKECSHQFFPFFGLLDICFRDLFTRE
jgi:hypothetical protein